MSVRSTVTVALVVGALAFAAGKVYSQDKPAVDGGMPAMPSDEEMKKMMAEMAAPAPEHKEIAAFAGTWDSDITHFEPGKEPKKYKGVTMSTSVLNGLYVSSTHKSEMDGQPFEGFAFDGYSKEKKKYFTFWADTMGSTPMLMWGTKDEATKTITYDVSEPYDCGAMGMMTPRMKMTHDDADHMTFEFWAKFGEMPEFMKMMEGKYTRRK
jgi:hypothetical protein